MRHRLSAYVFVSKGSRFNPIILSYLLMQIDVHASYRMNDNVVDEESDIGNVFTYPQRIRSLIDATCRFRACVRESRQSLCSSG